MELKTACISKLQRYSTKDGPGIRTTVFFVGCNLKCLWCANPELISFESKYLYQRNKCQKCGKCLSLFPKGSVKLTNDGLVIDKKTNIDLAPMAEFCDYEAYEFIGRNITSKELVKELLKDEVFYRQSSGGVTFSGGEAALNVEFLLEVIEELKKHNIHCALDTAGLIASDKFETLVKVVDLVLYDIKAIDSEVHIACTGVDNKLILENFKNICSLNTEIIVRLVLVPGYNDSEADLIKRVELINQFQKSISQVDVLFYHNLGVGKYLALNLDYPLKDIEVSEEYINKIKDMFDKCQVKVTYSK